MICNCDRKLVFNGRSVIGVRQGDTIQYHCRVCKLDIPREEIINND